MSKGHQANRRRSYGRRRHEVREREVRRIDGPEVHEEYRAERDGFRLIDLDFGAGLRLAAGD
jgi:hypothetical protein